MTERDIAAEVLRGLREVREHRAGRRTLPEARIEPTPIPELNPEMVTRICDSLDRPDSTVSHLLQESVTRESGPDSSGENGALDIENRGATHDGDSADVHGDGQDCGAPAASRGTLWGDGGRLTVSDRPEIKLGGWIRVGNCELRCS